MLLCGHKIEFILYIEAASVIFFTQKKKAQEIRGLNHQYKRNMLPVVPL